MNEDNITLASNYIYRRKEVIRLLSDIDAGRELNPQVITSMFPWSRSVSFLRALLSEQLAELDEELKKLGVDV